MRTAMRVSMLSIISALLIVSCGAASDFTAGRMQWDAARPEDYRITVRHTKSVWHSQDITLTVKGSSVTHQATCTPAPTEGRECEVEDYTPGDYTVEGLFEIASDLLGSDLGKHVTVTYDAEYGYPTRIAYDDPDLIDEDTFWIVIDFQNLDE